VPDRNGNFGGRFVNAGDPKWFDTLQDMSLDSADGVAGLRELLTTSYGRGLGCDGVFLDTIDTAAPDRWTSAASANESKFEWTAPGFGAFIRHVHQSYPDRVVLQNRGAFFSLDPRHPNALAPSKRPYSTIIPGMMTHADGTLSAAFGVMGGFMQPQGHMQMVINQVDYGMNPQTSLDAPRWRYDGGLAVAVEAHAPREVLDGLARRGHEVTVMEPTFNHGFGRGQMREHWNVVQKYSHEADIVIVVLIVFGFAWFVRTRLREQKQSSIGK
jgi:hypothetical protein